MRMEVWMVITGFENYEVSTHGNVRNKKTKKYISCCDKGDGYWYVTLYNDKKYVCRSVHTLLMKTFVENPENKPTVNHIDNDKKNNNITNLEWATHSEQAKHRISTSGVQNMRGREILKCDIKTGEIISSFDSIKKALESVGVTRSNQAFTITQNMSSAYGFQWKYEDDTYANENWKDIPESICKVSGYKLSSNGRVKNPRNRILRGYILKGYKYVCINKTVLLIHRLVAMVFLDEADFANGLVVNHKDGNKLNNTPANLEIVSQSDNAKHAYKMGLIAKKNKISIIQVDEYGNIVGQFESLTEAEGKTNINRGNIHKGITTGSTNKGFRWFSSMEQYENELKNDLLGRSFKVFQCDTNGNIIKTYNKYPEASKETNVSVTNISRSCKTHMLAGGFKWFQCYKDYQNYVFE
jgi:hypothetical protein